MMLTAHFPYQLRYTILNKTRAYNRDNRVPSGVLPAPMIIRSSARRILHRVKSTRLQQEPNPQPDDLMQFTATIWIISLTIGMVCVGFASWDQKLNEVKNSVNEIHYQFKRLDNKLDRLLVDVNEERVDIADLKEKQVKIRITR